MPFSDYHHIPAVLHFVTALRPASVLDVGVGMGCYGMLLRQQLDVSYERVKRQDWQVRIDGVEVFENYRNPVWEMYSTVTIADARDVMRRCDNYDLILLNDVLEHFERDEARTMIDLALQRGKALIATTPNYHIEQGAWGGNDAETHRSLLDESDFGADLVAMKIIKATNCYVCSRDGATVTKLKDAAGTCPAYHIDRVPYWKRRVERKLTRMLGGGHAGATS